MERGSHWEPVRSLKKYTRFCPGLYIQPSQSYQTTATHPHPQHLPVSHVCSMLHLCCMAVRYPCMATCMAACSMHIALTKHCPPRKGGTIY